MRAQTSCASSCRRTGECLVFIVELPFFCNVFFCCCTQAARKVHTWCIFVRMHSSDRSGEMTFIPGDDVQTFLFWRIGCVVPSSSEAYFSFFLSFSRCRRTADATKNHQTKLCSRYFYAALLSRIVPSVSSILLKATSTRSCDLEDLIPKQSLLILSNIHPHHHLCFSFIYQLLNRSNVDTFSSVLLS